MFRSLFNGALNAALLFIVFHNESNTSYFQNKEKDFILLVLVTIISSLISFLTDNLRRRLELTVTQKNRVTGKETTQYYQGETGQKIRTVNLDIILKRKRGLNFLIGYYLKKNKISILIECNPPGIELQALGEELLSDEINTKADNSGFYIDITDYIQSVSQHNTFAEPLKRIPFMVKETRESRRYFNANMACYINPLLIINHQNKAHSLLRFALGWKAEQHKIEYYHEEKQVRGEVSNAS